MPEAAPKKFARKPIGNFFIKKELQTRLIQKIVFSVMAATLVFAVTLLGTYHFTYGGLVYYPVDLNEGIGERTPILDLVMLPLLVSAVLNVLIAFGVGLYASRKYAVPIFKLEQWVSLLNEGNMTAKLRFREKEEMQELCGQCNALTANLHARFAKIKEEVDALGQNGSEHERIDRLAGLLDDLDLGADTIEVNTAYMDRNELLKGHKPSDS